MKTLLTIALSFLFSLCLAQLNGSYTIGGLSPDYATLSQAVDDLNLIGVNGPVTFNIRNGAYNEQVTISEFQGASSINSVTIQSESLDSSNVTFYKKSTSNETNYLIRLNGADFVTIRHLTLTQLPGSYGSKCIILENGANHNRISNLHLKGLQNENSDAHILIYSPSSSDNYNKVQYCHLESSFTGLECRGQLSALDTAWNISYNKFIECLHGAEIEYNFAPSLNANYISGKTGYSSSYRGDFVKFNRCFGGLNLKQNEFYSIYGGLKLNHCRNGGNSISIENNMITSGNSNACNIEQCETVHCLNNSFAKDRTSPSYPVILIKNSYAFFYNNIAANLGPGLSCEFYNSSVNSDNNVLFSNGVNLVKKNFTSYETLTDWQGSIDYPDINSISVDPWFVSIDNLHILSNVFMNQKGKTIGIPVDIDGDNRQTIPDIGADEFDLVDHDVAMEHIDVERLGCVGPVDFEIQIRNHGNGVLNTAVVNWTVNGIEQPVYNWNGSLSSGSVSSIFSIGSVEYEKDSTYNIVVWTETPNGHTDQYNRSDTSSIFVKTRMTGHYSVGKYTSDFLTIKDAIEALENRGICDSVFINIEPGVYTEALTIPYIYGTSDSSWIILQSISGDRTSVEIVQEDGTFDPDQVIALEEGCQYLFIRNLTIKRTDDRFGTNGNLIRNRSLQKLNSIFIENCVFAKEDGAHYDDAVNIGHIQNFRFVNNSILNGENGVRLAAYGATIEQNEFIGIWSHPIVIGSSKGIDVLRNKIHSSSELPSRGTERAIQLEDTQEDIEVAYNELIGPFGYCFYVLNCHGTSSDKIDIHHNMISCKNYNGNGSEAFMLAANEHVRIAHNNVNMSTSYSSGYSHHPRTMLNLQGNSAIEIVNNIFKADTLRNVYASLSGNQFDIFDHNLTFYDSITSVGWPSETNLNSIYANPHFVSSTDLHVSNPIVLEAGIGYGGYDSDFDGENISSPPAIGADEFSPLNVNLFVSNLSVSRSSCDSVLLSFDVTQFGVNDITSFTLNIYNKGIDTVEFHWSGNLPHLNKLSFDQFKLKSTPGINDIFVYTSIPNNLIDDNTSNDTVQTTLDYSVPEVKFTGPSQVCEGNFIELYIDSVYDQYSWSTGSASHTTKIYSPGNYYVEVSDSQGCKALDTIYIDSCAAPFEEYLPLTNCFFGQSFSSKYRAGTDKTILHILEDINGDAFSDLIELRTNGYIIFSRNEEGDFFGYQAFTVSSAVDLATQDFNNDSLPDFAVLGSSGQCGVFINDGTGQFLDSIYIIPSGANDIALGDINEDGFADILYTLPDDNSIGYLLGSNSGFSAANSFMISPTFKPNYLVLHDFTHDDKLDLAISYTQSSSDVSLDLFEGNGSGNFTKKHSVYDGIRGHDLTIGDANNDGIEDVVTSGISVFLGTADGILTYGGNLLSGYGNTNSRSILCEDVTGDGLTDIVSSHNLFNCVQIFRGESNILPSSQTTYQTGYKPLSSANGDFNGDGVSDIITLSEDESYQYMLGKGNGEFKTLKHIQLPVKSGFLALLSRVIVSDDFDGDGDIDLIVGTNANSSNEENTLFTYRNNGAGDFFLSHKLPLPQKTVCIDVADLNGDGLPDLGIAGEKNLIAFNVGDGQFTIQHSINSLYAESRALHFIDLDGDEKLDMITATYSHNVQVFKGNGNGYFTYVKKLDAFGSEYAKIESDDINFDGKMDVVISSDDDIYVLLNQGTFSFLIRQYTPSLYRTAEAFDLLDANGDGITDIVVGVDLDLNFLEGDSTGAFNLSETTIQLPNLYFDDIKAIDFTGDGKKDLAIVFGENKHLVLLVNNDGTFDFSQVHSSVAGKGRKTISVADFNSDSKPDFAVLSSWSNSISIDWNLLPTVEYYAPTDTLCLNEEPFTLSGGIPLGGIFYINGEPNTTFDPSVLGGGKHQITYKYAAPNSCVASALSEIIIPKSSTTISTIFGGLKAEQNEATYQWIDCNTNLPISGATNQEFQISEPGSFACIINYQGCADTSSCYFSTELSQPNKAFLIDLFPNPSQGVFELNIKGISNEVLHFNLTNQLGQPIISRQKSIDVNNHKENFDLKGISPGIYYLEVSSEKQQIVVKVMVQ